MSPRGFFVVLSLAVSVSLPSATARKNAGVSDVILKNLLLKSYSKTQYPPGPGPTDVKLGLYVKRLELCERDLQMALSVFVRQAWRDERLAFNSSVIRGWSDPALSDLDPDDIPENIYLQVEQMKQIFIPDIFFR